MNDQTATNTPSEPMLCAMGCGFFGNPATKGCCSKCWRESQKKQGLDTTVVPPRANPEDASAKEDSSPDKDEVMLDSAPKQEEKGDSTETTNQEEKIAVAPKKKGKKKKKTYKSLMAGMMTATDETSKNAKEKEALRKVTGGGAFQKIEKI